MTSTIIIFFCSLLLIAYLFNLTAPKTKIPSVILLLLLGWIIKQASTYFDYNVPELTTVLPVFATIGLILMVLEGSLELELNKSKIKLIKKSFFGALVPILVMAFGLAYLFSYLGNYSFKDNLINAIPLCIISSAIAIPSILSLTSYNKEFIIYESSLSDIIGILFFNLITLNETFGIHSFGQFGLQIVIVALVSVISTITLAFLLSKIDHHVKFVPIILLIILIYTIAKHYHLPALLFILFFGLSIGNIDVLKHNKWINKFHPENLKEEAQKLKELTIEAAFLVRALFFILFGYLLETAEILNTSTLLWSLGIVFAIFITRGIQLKLSRLPILPLLFIAPRGLITILLFLSIQPDNMVSFVNKSLVIQVIILTTLIMTLGLIIYSKPAKEQSL